MPLNTLQSKFEDAFYEPLRINVEIWGEIVHDELHMRSRTKVELRNDSDMDRIRTYIPKICPHLKGHDRASFRRSQTFLCHPCYDGRLPCAQCSGRKSCQRCDTNTTFTARELKDSKLEVQIEVCRNMGSCRSPFDHKWRLQMDTIGSHPGTKEPTAWLR